MLVFKFNRLLKVGNLAPRLEVGKDTNRTATTWRQANIGLPSTLFLTCKTRWTNRFLMTAVLLRIHAALCGATSSGDLWPAKSWLWAEAKRMCSSPPAHSPLQWRAKKGSSSTQQAFDSAYIYCSTRFPSHKFMQTCVGSNSPFSYDYFLM